jgi:hypothetical protein
MAVQNVTGVNVTPKGIIENIKKYAERVNVDKGQEILKNKAQDNQIIPKGIKKGFKIDTYA